MLWLWWAFDHRPNLNIARVGPKTRPNMQQIRFSAFANQTIILITGGWVFWKELQVPNSCSRISICQHFQTWPPGGMGADREALLPGDAELLYIMFCACFGFFHGDPHCSKQLHAAWTLLIPAGYKQSGCHSCRSFMLDQAKSTRRGKFWWIMYFLQD